MENENVDTGSFFQLLIANPLFWIIGILILLYFFRSWLPISNTRLPKKELVNIYGVDKKTFNKWVKYFCQESIPDFTAYKKRKTISPLEYFSISSTLGEPDEFPILTKKEIIEKAEGSYYSLQDCIKKYPERFRLTIESYTALGKFPPNIGKRILEAYG